MLIDKIRADLKQALLGGDRHKADTLKGLLTALQYEEVALREKNQTLDEEKANAVLAKELRKREETAEIYLKAGAKDRLDQEIQEKEIILAYLPEQISEEELRVIVKDAIAKTGAKAVSDMGKVIGLVKAQTKGAADGAAIAKIAKEELLQ